MAEPRPGTRRLLPHRTGSVVTVGSFDGVHRGHLDVLARLVDRARMVRLASILVTFEPHPLEILNPQAAPLLLSTREEKLAAVASTGLDYVAVIPFTRGLAAQTADEFVDDVLLERLGMRELLIGHDHGFGRGREGDVATLQALGVARGFSVHTVAPVAAENGEIVSSTLVRTCLAAGDLPAARRALGRWYCVSGRVIAGARRGRLLGYPTVNLELGSMRKLLPPDGVYAVLVSTRATQHGGMLNLGGRPTFDDDRRGLEAHLFDVDGDFYGEHVEVAFVARLRETKRFDGPDALAAQLAVDERTARAALTAIREPGNLNGSTPASPSTP